MTTITNIVNYEGKDVYCPFSKNKCRHDCMFLLISDSHEYFYCSLGPKYHKCVYVQSKEFKPTKFRHSGN